MFLVWFNDFDVTGDIQKEKATQEFEMAELRSHIRQLEATIKSQQHQVFIQLFWIIVIIVHISSTLKNGASCYCVMSCSTFLSKRVFIIYMYMESIYFVENFMIYNSSS